MSTLTDNYLDRIAAAIGRRTPCDPRLLRIYAVLTLTRGVNTTAEDVHHAWSAWRAETAPDHRSLVPFADLTPQVQALDEPYAAAIRAAAEGVFQ
jgi:hypothetical protein